MVRRDEALQALRRELIGREFAFATGLEVTDGGPAGFLVHVRSGQRLHPHTLVVPADEQSLTRDHLVDEPLLIDDVQTWAHGVVMWLMEQLDTGVLRWGRRVTLEDATVVIDPSLAPEPPPRWRVSSVPMQRFRPATQRQLRRSARDGRRRFVALGGGDDELEPHPAPGDYLRDVGFDITLGRAANADGRLVSWLQLFPDDSGGSPPVGQLVVSWRDASEAVAQLEHLQLLKHRTSLPRAAVEELALAGVHAAADAGARWIEHRFEHADPAGLGLPWQPGDGVMRLDSAHVP